MRKTTLLIGIVAGIAVSLLAVMGSGGGSASADNGPHVATGSDATPDKCAGCHRIHTAQNNMLLKEAGTIEQFCYSCHGSGGPGSDLAAQEGTFYGGTSAGAPYGNKAPSTDVGLRAGGFDFARINTTDPNIAGGTLGDPNDPYHQGSIGVGPLQTVNSWHAIDGTTAGTMWGNGAFGSGAGPSYTMDCASCHDPHGNGKYRILRSVPEGSGAAAGVNLADIGTIGDTASKAYTTTDYLQMGQATYTSTIAGNVGGLVEDMASWCAQCHTRYRHATAFDASFNADRSNGGASDSIYTYSHGTAGYATLSGVKNTFGGHVPGCETCHAEHGSNAQMPGLYSSTVPWPDGSTVNPANDTQRASLLKVDNRGTCRRCHPVSQVP